MPRRVSVGEHSWRGYPWNVIFFGGIHRVASYANVALGGLPHDLNHRIPLGSITREKVSKTILTLEKWGAKILTISVSYMHKIEAG
jgi:hypothetical protein